MPHSLREAIDVTDLTENWLEIPIESLRSPFRDLTFDVYLRLSESKIAHVFSRVTGIDYARLANYAERGVKSLLIRAEDRARFEEFALRSSAKILSDKSVPRERKLACLMNLTEQALNDIFGNLNVTESTAQSLRGMVQGYVKTLGQDPGSFEVLIQLASSGPYLYHHSLTVTIFSLMIARVSGQFNQHSLEVLGLGAFLHDLGETQLPSELRESTQTLGDSDMEVIHTHVRTGLQLLTQMPSIPEEVRFIVYQHHEEPAGRGGYPNRLRGSNIYYPAKVVALADGLAALLSKRPYRNAFSMEESLRILRESTNRGRYDRELFRCLEVSFSRWRLKHTA
jgi:putative nucleotidyltransferase with HDIG domain